MRTDHKKKLIAARIAQRRFDIETERKRRNARLKHWIKYGAHGAIKTYQSFQKKPIRTIDCPSVLDLSEHLQDTVNLVSQIRKWVTKSRRAQIYIDFASISSISPAAALLLSSEIHRWSILRPYAKIGATTIDDWDSSVQKLFLHMGLFKLINIENRELIKRIPEFQSNIDRRYMPFFHGERREPKKVVELRNEIESLTGRIKKRRAFYDGLTEAILNVRHHAYNGYSNIHRWWISASIDHSNRSLTVMCLDHGIGIAESLRQSKSQELGERGLGAIRDKLAMDHDLITAAVEGGRSSTGLYFRGRGLRKDIKRYVEQHDSAGSLRIYSGRGYYSFEIERNGEAKVISQSLSARFPGTFIEWKIYDYMVQDDGD